MAFTVVYDACILYGEVLRDFLVRLANSPLVTARWSEQIVDEVANAVLTNHPHLRERWLSPNGTRAKLLRASREGPIENYSHLEASFPRLPDAKDAHVIAAAVSAGAQVIVTKNLKDFPSDVLALHFLEAQDPDTFVLGLIDLNPAEVLAVLHGMSGRRKTAPRTIPELLNALERDLPNSVELLRAAIQHP
jgi:predicted nucleic acid-binding protein